MIRRWTYRSVEVKPAFIGIKRDAVDKQMNQAGQQACQLVSVVRHDAAAWLYFSKEQ